MKGFRILRVVLGVVLFIAAACIFLYPNYREWRTQRDVDRIIEDFEKSYEDARAAGEEESDTNKAVSETEADSEATSEAGTEGLTEEAEHLTSELLESGVSDHSLYAGLYEQMLAYNQDLYEHGQSAVSTEDFEQVPVDLSVLGNGDMVGYVEIPDMKVRLPLLLGASLDHLAMGAAVLSQTSMPIGGENTNCVISGHRGYNGSAYFQRIDRMKKGSVVYVTNPWETLVYEAVSVKIVGDTDASPFLIQPGKDMVTLFSCHPYVIGGGPYRYIVFCERVGTLARTEFLGTENPSVADPPKTTDEPVTEGEVDVPEVVDKDSQKMQPVYADDVTAQEVEESGIANLAEIESWLRVAAPVVLLLFFLLMLILRRGHKNSGSGKDDEFY